MLGETAMAKPTTRAGMPYADMPLAQYLAKQIDIQASMGKTARQIAQEVGYDSPNMVSMLKRGEAKLPLDRVPAIAKALNVDPAYLFRLALQQYWPDMQRAIAEIFGTVFTANEIAIIHCIRHITKGADPALTTALERKLKEAFRD
jgi:transcriptional regulator with XRE-family HTH domain